MGEHPLMIRDYLRQTQSQSDQQAFASGVEHKAQAQARLGESILPVEIRVPTKADVVAPSLHPN
jgi:hypothetical protein